MTKMINWQKRKFDSRPKTNINDENEFCKSDMAAKWIEQEVRRLAYQRKQKRKHKQRPAQPAQPVMRPRPAGPDETPPWED